MNIHYESLKFNKNYPIIIEELHDSYPASNEFHWHEAIEISYVVTGELECQVKDKKYILNQGDIIIFNCLEPHTWRTITETETSLQPVIVFEPSLLCSDLNNFIDSQYVKPFYDKTINFNNKLSHEDENSKIIFQLLEDIRHENKTMNTGYQLIIKAKLLELVANLIRYFYKSNISLETAKKQKKELYNLENAIDYINKNYKNDIKLIDVANSAFMSSSYFSSLFKKTFGISYRKYLVTLRVKKVRELKTTSNLSMIEIIQECGFNTISAYYKAVENLENKQ